MTLDLARLPEALRDHGVTVVEFGPWLTRGYDDVSFEGSLNHHTAIRGPVTASTAQAMVNGRSDLPGPIANGHGGLDARGRGVYYLIAGRRARHAGVGARRVFDDLLRNIEPSGDARARGLPDDDRTHGNRHLWGDEWQHPGDDSPYPDALLELVGRVNAARHELAGWAAERATHHREWTTRKIDMSWRGDLRALVRTYMEDDVALTDDERAWLDTKFGEINRNLATVRGNDGTTDADKAHVSVADVHRAVLAVEQRVAAMSTGSVDYDTLADKVADRLAARLGNG